MEIGRSIHRVDALDKVTGRAKYTDDLRGQGVLVARILHSTIANGVVKDMDLTEARKVPGVVKILTCFDVPDIQYPTPGHPWSVETAHQDVADRKLLAQRVRIYGEDIAVVVAEDEIAAEHALKAIKVTYEEYPVYTDPEAAMAPGAVAIHDEHPDNILRHTCFDVLTPGAGGRGVDEVFADPAYRHFEAHIDTQAVQHCHIENPVSYAWMEGDRIMVVSSTQIPHIVRRVIGQALGIGWGKVRVIKPYIGGGFGNKQEVLYEPLNAWITTQIGGRKVKLELTREETFQNTRSRHAIHFDVKAAVDPESMRLMARTCRAVSNQGGYASHGHSIVANAVTGFRQTYPDAFAHRSDAYTVYTNLGSTGAMRGYGIPQCNFAGECFMDDIAREMGWDPMAFRLKNIMPLGYVDPTNGITCHSTGLAECIRKGAEFMDWERLRAEYAKPQTGPIRRGIGMAVFSYKTGVWPISLETSSARVILNQDGTVQLQLGATEIGQGGDTVFSQMCAQAIGIPTEDVHIVSFQDTDTAPFDTGAYASRQTYVTGKAIKKVGLEFREKLLAYAAELFPEAKGLTISERFITDGAGEKLISLAELATTAFYSLEHSVHISAEDTNHCKENTFAFGCCFAEVEVDIPVGKIRVLRIVNVHDSGKLINPRLAEAQVHGGMSMGLGYALSEEMKFDPKTGRLLNGNLLDYKLPTAMDHPELHALFVETDDPSGPFGNKALGEPPAIPVAGAVRNAVLQATGVAIHRLPMNPQRMVEAFTEAGLIEKGE